MSAYLQLKNLSDRELLQRIEKSGEQEAIGILLERYSHLVVILCLQYTGDEAAAKAASRKVLRQLHIDLQNRSVGQFNQWVYRVIVQNCAMQRTTGEEGLLSENRPENTPGDPLPALQGLKGMTTWSAMEREKRVKELVDIFNTLTKKEQDCMTQFYVEGKTFAETGRQLNLPPEAVRKHIREGKRKILAAIG